MGNGYYHQLQGRLEGSEGEELLEKRKKNLKEFLEKWKAEAGGAEVSCHILLVGMQGAGKDTFLRRILEAVGSVPEAADPGAGRLHKTDSFSAHHIANHPFSAVSATLWNSPGVAHVFPNPRQSRGVLDTIFVRPEPNVRLTRDGMDAFARGDDFAIDLRRVSFVTSMSSLIFVVDVTKVAALSDSDIRAQAMAFKNATVVVENVRRTVEDLVLRGDKTTVSISPVIVLTHAASDSWLRKQTTRVAKVLREEFNLSTEDRLTSEQQVFVVNSDAAESRYTQAVAVVALHSALAAGYRHWRTVTPTDVLARHRRQ